MHNGRFICLIACACQKVQVKLCWGSSHPHETITHFSFCMRQLKSLTTENIQWFMPSSKSLKSDIFSNGNSKEMPNLHPQVESGRLKFPPSEELFGVSSGRRSLVSSGFQTQHCTSSLSLSASRPPGLSHPHRVNLNSGEECGNGDEVQ